MNWYRINEALFLCCVALVFGSVGLILVVLTAITSPTVHLPYSLMVWAGWLAMYAIF